MIKRNIIILPDILVSKRAIELSGKLSTQYKTTFTLDGKQFYPHITLYQAEYLQESMIGLEQKLFHIAKSISPFCVRATTFSTFRGFLFLNIKKDNEVVSLQKSIISALGPLSKSLSPLAGDTFVPHITITRLQYPDDAKRAVSILGRTEISFEVHSLHVADIGPDGTVNELLKEIPFG